MAGDGFPRIEKLDTDNYLQWNFQIVHLLRIRECWSAVAPVVGAPTIVDGGAISATSAAAGGAAVATAGGGEVPPNNTAGGMASVSTTCITAARAEELAKSIMALSVQFHHLATFRLHPTARGVWEALGAEFRSSRAARLSNLRQEMAMLEQRRNETIVRYFNRGRTIT